MKRFIYFTIITFLLSCSSTKKAVVTAKPINYYIEKTTTDLKNWHHKDIYTDSIPGISFERAEAYLQNKDLKDTVLIAAIDTELYIKGAIFKDNIWVNKNEIPDNQIDDDSNGYVDDIHGWNFIRGGKDKHTDYTLFESTRILRKFNYLLQNTTDTVAALGENYAIYKKAKEHYAKALDRYTRRKNHANYLYDNYESAYQTVNDYFPNRDYTTKELDSLYLKFKDEDRDKASKFYYVSDCIKYDIDKEWVDSYKFNSDNIVEKCLNINYDERMYVDDDPEDIDDITYGTSDVLHDKKETYHSSQVCGILVKDNHKKFIKIMPVVISARGDEHDKDIALAIRYAVDNGAKIINMSSGKYLSFHSEWILDAITYAANNDVLFVTSAGNESINVDGIINENYPSDIDKSGNEVTNNLIMVGASTKYVNEKLAANFSNYNNEQIDIFAPGDSIYVYAPEEKYFYNSGTSLAAPMVSKAAALIRSYYPNLSAAEVKQIIMESGVSYDIMVNKPSTSKAKELVPFSSLSKSGKIVNAYNALLLAEKVSKKKKK